MKKEAPLYTNVDEYIAQFPAPVQAALEHLRQLIRTTAPNAQEMISYQMPAYKGHGMLVYFGGFKNHCSLFAVGTVLFEKYKEALAPYKKSKGTIQFTLENPLPDALVISLLQDILKADEEKYLAKKKKK